MMRDFTSAQKAKAPSICLGQSAVLQTRIECP